MSISTKLLAGTAASLLSLACMSAYAGEAVEFNHSSIVRYADLDLSRPQDVVRLYQRITLAADQLCGPRALTGAYAKSAAYLSCYSDAISKAIARVNHASLTSYYLQRWPQPVAVAQQ